MREERMVVILLILIFLLAIALTGCGNEDRVAGADGINAQPCVVEEMENGVNIECPDSSTFIPYPEDTTTTVIYVCDKPGKRRAWYAVCE